MTKNEAIKVLDRITVKNTEQKYNTPYEIGEALNMAIKALEFAEWVAEEIFSDWEYSKDSFAEIACRKLEKMGIVRKTETDWVFNREIESEVEL